MEMRFVQLVKSSQDSYYSWCYAAQTPFTVSVRLVHSNLPSSFAFEVLTSLPRDTRPLLNPTLRKEGNGDNKQWIYEKKGETIRRAEV